MTRSLISETLARLASRHEESARDDGSWDRLWSAMEEHGLTRIGIPERLGGSGGTVSEAAEVIRTAGRWAASVPVVETCLLGGWTLAQCGVSVPAGILTVANATSGAEPNVVRSGGGWELTGRCSRVPWARSASQVVVMARDREQQFLVLVDPNRCDLRQGTNLAGEPRDDLVFPGLTVTDEKVLPLTLDPEWTMLLGALGRALSIAGALERVMEICVQYVQNREQFGRPIGTFQAIQHHLAVLAGEVAAVGAATGVAVESMAASGPGGELAAAKIRAGQAAGTACRIAHQVHGAIGLTDEYPLHRYTLCLWSWRDEFGTESLWAERLGRAWCSDGGREFWSRLTRWPCAPDAE